MHWGLVILEVAFFIAAIITAYLSQVGSWTWFAIISIVMTIAFSIVKVFEAMPSARELLARDDMASRLAISAERYGVREYFNMQNAKDQALRNEKTQQDIESAASLWLCANSGASFLEPSIYRHWQFIEKRLKDGVEFRVVLLDPYSAEKRLRNQLNVGENTLIQS